MHISEPRKNAHFNETQPEEYYDYTNYKIKPGDIDKYVITQRIGKGKYSEVFEGAEGDDRIVIKVLKPVRDSKINREVKILKNLDHQNIITLKDVVIEPVVGTCSLIFKYIPHKEATKLFESFSIEDICLYSKQMLEALSYAHSRGIMHRDIKPHNMIIDDKNKKLKIIDWGLAEFYHIGQSYSVRVASRYYKSPELLVEYPYYDYSLDLWSFGCVLAEMIFKKKPMFKGDDNFTQLKKIVNLLGTNDFDNYLKKFNIPLKNNKFCDLPRDRVDLQSFLPSDCDFSYILAVDLLEKILVYDHVERYTADECLQHPFYHQKLNQ